MSFDVATPHAREHLACPHSTHVQLACRQRWWSLAVENLEVFEQCGRELAFVEEHSTAAQLHHLSVGRFCSRGRIDERVEEYFVPQPSVADRRRYVSESANVDIALHRRIAARMRSVEDQRVHAVLTSELFDQCRIERRGVHFSSLPWRRFLERRRRSRPASNRPGNSRAVVCEMDDS